MRDSKLFSLSIFALLSGFAIADAVNAQPEGPPPGGFEDRRVHMRPGERMKEVDTNGDGKISRSEFVSKAEERFSKMDKDGDGYLTKEEMKAMRGKRKGFRENLRGRFGNNQPSQGPPAEGDF